MALVRTTVNVVFEVARDQASVQFFVDIHGVSIWENSVRKGSGDALVCRESQREDGCEERGLHCCGSDGRVVWKRVQLRYVVSVKATVKYLHLRMVSICSAPPCDCLAI